MNPEKHDNLAQLEVPKIPLRQKILRLLLMIGIVGILAWAYFGAEIRFQDLYTLSWEYA